MRKLIKTYLELLFLFTIVFSLFIFFFWVYKQLSLTPQVKFSTIQESTLATIFTATAISTSGIVAFRAFQLNSKITQEPWSVIFRELHNEFWNDPEIARVRKWLCSDEAYEKELLPVLQSRKCKPVDSSSYEILESLDKYCALMVRVNSLQSYKTYSMNAEQQYSYEVLGYDLWLHKTIQRKEIHEYIKSHWKNLFQFLPTEPPKG
jgi:hypothetical protein